MSDSRYPTPGTYTAIADQFQSRLTAAAGDALTAAEMRQNIRDHVRPALQRVHAHIQGQIRGLEQKATSDCLSACRQKQLKALTEEEQEVSQTLNRLDTMTNTVRH